MQQVILIHYGELALKQGNRSFFEDRLIHNIQEALRPIGGTRIRKLYGRLVLEPGKTDVDAICEALRNVFGIAWFARAWMAPAHWDGLLEATAAALPDRPDVTFGVRTKKADQTWAKGRTETSRDLGAWIVERTGWKVNLTDPDIWVQVEVASGNALVAVERHSGRQGLPLGVSGRVVSLLSGGIDSPVASWSMMARGLRTVMLHFHSAPFTNQASQEKVVDLARALLPFQPSIVLHGCAFAPLQQEIVAQTPQRYRVILYRRFMMRIAERVARRERAAGLVTGESLGQVASQTLPNLRTVEAVTSLPVLRPLIGSDKQSITRIARDIGTYDISILPHEDCCSFLMPRKPATRSTPEELAEVEEALDVDGLVKAALERIETQKLMA